jgi:hypothetical protein
MPASMPAKSMISRRRTRRHTRANVFLLPAWGYTFAEASAKAKTKSGYRVPPSTLAAWIACDLLVAELTKRACFRIQDHGRARYGLIPSRSELQVKKTSKASTTIRANKRKAKLKAKHRRQRARATS